jgi:hypothetical protein
VSQFHWRGRYRWLVMTLIFGIGPLVVYLVFISPAIQKITDYQEKVKLQTASATIVDLGPTPASDRETEQLAKIRMDQTSRVKKINDREALLRFSGALADAVAFQARSFGLRVKGVNLKNASIDGKYLPSNEGALERLTGLPAPQWEELINPLDLPMLRMPSIEVQLTAVSEYSQVFSFIESLPNFPTLVQLTGLQTMDDSQGKAYQLTIRGYYCSKENLKQTVPPGNAVY